MEVWKKIKGYSHYEISNLGRVRSLDKFVRAFLLRGNHTVEARKLVSGRILKQTKTRPGYFQVTLHGECKPKTHSIHRLVLSSFMPIKYMEKFEVNHINHVKTDNTLDNLEWCTRLENMHKANIFGALSSDAKIEYYKTLRGETHPSAKLTNKDILLIRKSNKTHAELGRFFGVKYQTISSIRNGKAWKHLNGKTKNATNKS